MWAFEALSPPIGRRREQPPPPDLAPYEVLRVPRLGRPGHLGSTFFPALTRAPRGAVLLCPPRLQWGRAYLHRRGRLETLREAGYHALTFDLAGFGASDPAEGMLDRDVGDALEALRERVPGLPLHLWGISSGGTWALIALSRNRGVQGAFFEDTPAHLFEWSHRIAPRWAPAYRCYRSVLRRAYRFLDLRRHAPGLQVRTAAFLSGGTDPGVPSSDTRELASLAAAAGIPAAARVLPGLAHLEAVKRAPREVFALALEAFARAEGLRQAPTEELRGLTLAGDAIS